MSRTTDDATDDEPNTEHRISESADKLTLTTKVKRGDGTRDEDRIKVKVKGDDPDEVVEKLEQTVVNLNRTTNYLRGLRAGGSDVHTPEEQD